MNSLNIVTTLSILKNKMNSAKVIYEQTWMWAVICVLFKGASIYCDKQDSF